MKLYLPLFSIVMSTSIGTLMKALYGLAFFSFNAESTRSFRGATHILGTFFITPNITFSPTKDVSECCLVNCAHAVLLVVIPNIAAQRRRKRKFAFSWFGYFCLCY